MRLDSVREYERRIKSIIITEDEIYKNLSPERVTTKTAMQAKLRQLIDTVKKREERDNISAAMFRAEV